MSDRESTNRLGEYLMARRGLVTPERAGLLAGPNRRVKGLRREEVALLAGISVDYYLRLERGKDSHPSRQVLETLARVLLLDEVETDYLMTLGATAPKIRRKRRPEKVPPRLHDLLRLINAPAFIEGRYFDVLASNELAIAFSPRLAPGNNRLLALLLDPEEQEFHVHWERSVEAFIALFRHTIADYPDDARAVELVGELSIASAHFREVWGRHDVRPLLGGPAEVLHPVAGPLQLNREKMPIDDLVLVIYYPESGSATEERLQLLASLITHA